MARQLAEVFSLNGKVAIVTGASGLLGRHHCHALAQAGATVVVTDLDAEQCGALAAELRNAYSRSSYGCKVDIADRGSVSDLRESVLGRYGRVDVLVNNAAIDDVFEDEDPGMSGFEGYPLERWQRLIEVNLTGTFLCCQIIGSEMARRRSGSIV